MPSAELVLLLNPDAILRTDITPLLRCFDDPLTAIAAGALCNHDLQPQRGFTFRRFPTPAALALETLTINRAWPGNSVNRRWRCLDLDLTQSQDIDQPAGAFLLIRREAWNTVAGFEENFRPVWFEDVDFCLRIRQAGFRICYEPLAIAVHEGGHSVRAVDWGDRQVYWNENLLRYSRSHFSPLGPACYRAVGCGRWSSQGIMGSIAAGLSRPAACVWAYSSSSGNGASGVFSLRSSKNFDGPPGGEFGTGDDGLIGWLHVISYRSR